MSHHNYQNPDPNREEIQQKLENWFERHAEWEPDLLAWSVKYLRNNPLIDSDTTKLDANRNAIIEYICSARVPSKSSEKVRRMMVAWRAEKHRFKKHVVHLTISDEAYTTLQKFCDNWRKKSGSVIEQLLAELRYIEKTVHKEEQKRFKDKEKAIKERYQKKINNQEKNQRRDINKLESSIRTLEKEKLTLLESLKELKDLTDTIILEPPLEGIDSELATEYTDKISEIYARVSTQLLT